MTGGAWLSSARVVKCQVKSCNERNPCLLLLFTVLKRNCRSTSEEGVDDVKSACPLHPGLHTYYNATDKGQQVREDKQIP